MSSTLLQRFESMSSAEKKYMQLVLKELDEEARRDAEAEAAKKWTAKENDLFLREGALKQLEADLAKKKAELKEEQEVFRNQIDDFKISVHVLRRKEDDLAKRQAELENRQHDLLTMNQENLDRKLENIKQEILSKIEKNSLPSGFIALPDPKMDYAGFIEASREAINDNTTSINTQRPNPEDLKMKVTPSTAPKTIVKMPSIEQIPAQTEPLFFDEATKGMALALCEMNDHLIKTADALVTSMMTAVKAMQNKLSPSSAPIDEATPALAVEVAPEPALDERKIANVMLDAGVNRGDAIRALRAAEGEAYLAERLAKKERDARMEKRLAELPRTDTAWIDEKSEEWKAAERLVYGYVVAEEDERREKERTEAAKVEAGKKLDDQHEEREKGKENENAGTAKANAEPRASAFQQQYNASFAAGAQYQAGLQDALNGATISARFFSAEYESGYATGLQQLQQLQQELKKKEREMTEAAIVEDPLTEKNQAHEELSSDDSYETIDYLPSS